MAEETSQPERSTISLRARTRQAKSGSMIQLQWHPSAKPIRRSSCGILYIYDGGIPRQLLLHRRAFDFGSTGYKPMSDEVLSIWYCKKGRPGGESMLVWLGARQAAHIGLESNP